MKAYPEYKASGIDWIGNIPSHWMVAPIKTLLTKSSSGVWGEEAKEDGNDVVCFRVADFDYSHLCLKYNNITYRSITQAQMQGREVEYGDIVIEKSGGGDLNPVGRAVMSTFEGLATCSNFMHVISANGRAINSFLNYLLATIYCKGLNRLYFAQTTGIQNLNIREYLAQRIALPSLDEQRKIVEYLNDASTKIDALISEKRKQVEVIRAYRTSLITETVTRGINPDAKLRPSGIDWIGKIPSHWNVVNLKYLINEPLMYGANESPEIETNLSNPRYIRITDIDENGCLKKDTFRTLQLDKAQPYFLRYGDILFARSGATVGKTYRFTEDYPAAFAGYLIKASCGSKIDSLFLLYYTNTQCYNNWKNSIFDKSTIQNISADKYNNLPVVVPPLSEQQAIADFLDAKTEKIDELVGELIKQIDELTEYKQSVITEAVTGKVDVRDYKPSN